MDSEFEKKLFPADKETYGEKYNEHLLEQYKVYFHSAEKISDRRQKNNDFFLAINTALLATLSFLNTKSEDNLSFIIGLSSVAGICISYFWYRIVKSYKDLNTGKFKVLHQIEKRLPISPLDAEWEALGRGENSRLYLPFSHIEINIPLIFVGFYVTVLIWSLDMKEILEFICSLHR